MPTSPYSNARRREKGASHRSKPPSSQSQVLGHQAGQHAQDDLTAPSSRSAGAPPYTSPTPPALAPMQVRTPKAHSGQSERVRHSGPLFRKIQNDASPNIVIFGETGTGKSSLINMLADAPVATVSNLAVGCTFGSAPYPVTINGRHYTLWDTAGLNEGDAGSVPGEAALNNLRDLVEKLQSGLSLLVYCIRGSRYRDIIKVNYDLFTEIICQGEIPVVIVVTGLENEERMDDWWVENESEFTSRKMNFKGHACVTTTKGKRNMFEEEYEESREVLRALIENSCPSDSWAVDSAAWFQRISSRIQEYYDIYNGYSSPPDADMDVDDDQRFPEQGGRGQGTLKRFLNYLYNLAFPPPPRS